MATITAPKLAMRIPFPSLDDSAMSQFEIETPVIRRDSSPSFFRSRAASAHASAHRSAAPAYSRTRPRDSRRRSEEHTSELQSLMRISYAVFCLKKKKEQIMIET